MTLVTAGSLVWPIPLTENQRDWRVLQALAEDWPRMHLFAKTDRAGRARWSQGGITCEYFPARRLSLLGPLPFLLSVVRGTLRLHRQDPVALFVASDPVSGLAGWLVKRRTGVPVLLHLQGELVEPPASYGSRQRRASIAAITRWVCRRVDAVRVVQSGQIAEVVALGVPAERISVVGSRCDTTQYDRAKWRDQGDSVRRERVPSARFLAVYVGTLIEGKGVQVAIEAWAGLRDRLPGAHLLIVGDGPYRPALEQLVDRHGLRHAVHFIGAAAYDDVPAYLAAADAFVFTSFSEGSPRAVIEAMSMSLPVVATHVGGIPELIADGATGLLVPAGDRDALADCLVTLAGDAEYAARLGAAARRVAVSRFDFARVMAEMRALYRRVGRREMAASVGEGRLQ